MNKDLPQRPATAKVRTKTQKTKKNAETVDLNKER